MKHGANAVILGRKSVHKVTLVSFLTAAYHIFSAERLQEAANELSKDTGRQCFVTPADVRKPEQVRAAVAKAVEKFGRIDFVINGT